MASTLSFDFRLRMAKYYHTISALWHMWMYRRNDEADSLSIDLLCSFDCRPVKKKEERGLVLGVGKSKVMNGEG